MVLQSRVFDITGTFQPCQNGQLGPLCQNGTADYDVTKLGQVDIKANQWVYYKFLATAANPLWVSVAPQQGKVMPEVYASVDQTPQKNFADVKNCNQPNCQATTIIFVNNTMGTNTTWYIGVTSPNDTSYGIWFSQVCAPNCLTNGVCTPYGSPDAGKCACQQDYVGLDCLTYSSDGIQPQYIVLIIIASLVVASAIIGFIAWAYMQKKRQGYVKVKD